MATTAELLQTAKDKLAIVMSADAASYVDYKIGDKSVSKGQYVNHLLSIIERLSDVNVQGEVDLEFVQFDADINLAGDDNTQYTTLL